MGITNVVGKIINRGLGSKYLLSTKNIGNQTIMLFHNPKSGNSVIKSIDREIGLVDTYGYKGTRRILSFDGKRQGLIDAVGQKTLRESPEALALSYIPDKAISESVNPVFKYKYIASNGQVTEYENLSGNWFKGKTDNQSVSEFVNRNPFLQ